MLVSRMMVNATKALSTSLELNTTDDWVVVGRELVVFGRNSNSLVWMNATS